MRYGELKTKPANPTNAYSASYAYKAESSGNIYFLIKDKRDEFNLSRKDSLLDFASKRERTKSEAVNDISVSAVNQIVSQLIEKEFQVFGSESLKTNKAKEN